MAFATAPARARLGVLTLVLFLLANFPRLGTAQQPAPDPFAPLRALRGEPTLAPARALAVIPERHTGRLLRFADVLTEITPEFEPLAHRAGFDARNCIQIRTRDSGLTVFVMKSQTNVNTLLQLALGSRIEVDGVLVEYDGAFVFVANAVRSSAARPSTAPR